MRTRQAPQSTSGMPPGLSPLTAANTSSTGGIKSHSSTSFSLHAVMMSQAELPAHNKKSLLELKTQMQSERGLSPQPARADTSVHENTSLQVSPKNDSNVYSDVESVDIADCQSGTDTATCVVRSMSEGNTQPVLAIPSLEKLPEHEYAQLTGVSDNSTDSAVAAINPESKPDLFLRDSGIAQTSNEERTHNNNTTASHDRHDVEQHIYRDALPITHTQAHSHTQRPVSGSSPMRRGHSHDNFSQPRQNSNLALRHQEFSCEYQDERGVRASTGTNNSAGKRAQSERSVQFRDVEVSTRQTQQHVINDGRARASYKEVSSHTSNRPKSYGSNSTNNLSSKQGMSSPQRQSHHYQLPTGEGYGSKQAEYQANYERSTSHPPVRLQSNDTNWHRSNDEMYRNGRSDDQFRERGTRQSRTRPLTQQIRANTPQLVHTPQYYDGPSRTAYTGAMGSSSHGQLHSGRPQQSPMVIQHPKHRSQGVSESSRSSRRSKPHSAQTGHRPHTTSKFPPQHPLQQYPLQSHSGNHLVAHTSSHDVLRSDSDILSPSFHRHPLGYDDSEYLDEEGYAHTPTTPQARYRSDNVRGVTGSPGSVDVGKVKSVCNSPGSPMFTRDGYNNGTIGSDYGSAVINIDYSGEEDLSYEGDSYVSDAGYYLTEREYHESLMGSLRDHMPQPRAFDEYLHNSRTVHVDVGTAGLGISIKGGLEYGLPILVADVMADGPASNLLDVGDVILTVNGVIVYMVNHEDAVSVLKQAGNSLTLQVVRDPALRDLIKGSVKPQAEKIKNDFVPTVTEFPWSNDEMPEGWYKGVCPSTDRNYFINPHTKTTTWLDPREEIYMKRNQIKKQAKGVLPFGWEEVRTDEGELYYANHLKKITQWDHPNPKKEPSRKTSWAMLFSPRSSKTSNNEEDSGSAKPRGSILSAAKDSILSSARNSILSSARGSGLSSASVSSRTNSVSV